MCTGTFSYLHTRAKVRRGEKVKKKVTRNRGEFKVGKEQIYDDKTA
jgi:hypothetical protein